MTASYYLILMCIFVATFSAICSAAPSLPTSTNNDEHKIIILNSDDMPTGVQLEAAEVLRRGLKLGDYHKTCILLRDYFQEKYPDYTWHAVDYNSYAIHFSKAVNFEIDKDRRIVLFANSR